MGSVAAVYLADNTVIAANVGDSPIYLIRNGKIDLLSVTHTLQAAAAGEAQAAFMGNVLTRAVGPRDTVEADICELNCFKGDTLVICSDGLSTKVKPAEILSVANSRPPTQASPSVGRSGHRARRRTTYRPSLQVTRCSATPPLFSEDGLAGSENG
jgi:protein phosphatase